MISDCNSDTPNYVLDYYDRVIHQTEGMNIRTFNISKGIAHMKEDAFAEYAKQNLEWIKWIEEANASYDDF